MLIEFTASMKLCSASTSTFGSAYDLDLNPRPVPASHHSTSSKSVVSGLSVLLANSKHCSSGTVDSFELGSALTTFVRGTYLDGVESYADPIGSSSPNSMKTRELSPVSVLQEPFAYCSNGQSSGRRYNHSPSLEQHAGSSVRVCSSSKDPMQFLLSREECTNRGICYREECHSNSLTEPQQLLHDLPETVALHFQEIAENILLDAQHRQEIFKDAFVIRAFREAEKAHRGQFRTSGDIYLVHCVETAIILAEIGASQVVIAAGLLHDIMDDSYDEYSNKRLAEMFGKEVADLVEGVSKLSEFSKLARDNDIASKKLEADRLHTMFLAMADVQVVLIKLADRLHNMRTLSALSEEKQLRMAKETLEIFAALANRLGIWSWKAELEDLCFKHLKPLEHEKLATKLAGGPREVTIAESIQRLEKVLHEEGVLYHELSGRSKSLYGIYTKMTRKGMNLEEIYDVQGLRLIMNTKEDCYKALKTVHRLWSRMSASIKDYIIHPKENGYQSLHTVVQGDDGFPLEVQIRTVEMHHQAEFGVAAHWRYKENNVELSSHILQTVGWARWMLTWHNEILETKSRLPFGSSNSRSACSFPHHQEGCPHVDMACEKGEGPLFVIILDDDKMSVQELPRGSTVGDLLDKKVEDSFAATGGVSAFCEELLPRVNHKVVDIDQRLEMGDLVEMKPLISDDTLLEYRNRIKRMYGDTATQERKQSVQLSP